MHPKNNYISFFFFFLSLTTFAQKSEVYSNSNEQFEKAILLYKNKQYGASQILFEKIKSETNDQVTLSDCDYYAAFCAIKLDQSNADDLMENFVENYPSSAKQNLAFSAVATHYFDKGDYLKAIDYFDKIDENSLTPDEIEKFNFQKAYSYFSVGKKKEATTYFNKVINSNDYGSQSKYYLGYMAYEKDDYKEANKQFVQVQSDEKFKEKLSYFQADMNFKLGKFQQAIDLGMVALNKSNENEVSELNKIIGESYFNLKKYDKALEFLKEYKGKNGKWNNTDFYQLGYTYYKQNDFQNAISQFNKIIDGKDFVAQNAFYHLGESYLKLDQKTEALTAFKAASEMNFDKKIKEDAALNYAKLSYEIGNQFKSVPDVLSTFIQEYPTNLNKPEIENLLVNSYVTSKNYKDALVLLEKNKNPNNRITYQKVCFYRGIELFTDGNYKEALSLFNKSIAENKDVLITTKSTFWKAETEFIQNDFANALLSFKQFAGNADAKTTSENKNINYNIAYCYFKQKEYEQASTFFQNQIDANKLDKTRLNDSYLRLGDCRFVTSKYALAQDAYAKSIEMNVLDSDYASFQKAISNGFIGKNDKKITELNAFISKYKNSQYRDDAMFELANSYVIQNSDDLALKTYDQLISEYKNGTYTAKSILKQGLVHYNNQKNDEAIAKFKKVAADFPKTTEASEAVATAKLIYIDTGKMDEYANWVKGLGYIEVSDSELDNDTFEGAEKQYLQNNSKQAISSLSGYVAKFPNGIHALKANFYLAQLYFADNLVSNSIPNYEFVVSKPRSEFTEQALSRLSEIYLKKSDFENAIKVLLRLENESDFPQNKTYAQANLMRSYYNQKDYSNSVIYAEKVLVNPKTDDKIKSDAQIIVARSAIKVNDEVKAKTAYANLQKIAKGELLAEALYYDAYFKNKENKFLESNKVVQKIAKDFSGYKYFGAKALIIMAKNYYSLKDSFQATAILQSVIENFTEFNDVVTDAQKELDLIKTEEAKTNSSLTK